MSLPFPKWSRRSTSANRRSNPGTPASWKLTVERLEARDLPAGTWTALTNLVPTTGGNTGAQSMMLLSDGRVLVHGGSDTSSTNWYVLTPNASGSYINGTFTQVASSNVARLFFTSDLLPNGDVFVVGGEYSGPNTINNDANTGEIYDPVTNTWAAITNFPQASFGDDPSEVLANGTVLAGYIFGPQTYIWTPTPGTTAPGTWAASGTKLVPGDERSDEETWVKLPDGSILSYDIFNDAENGISSSQRYVQSSGSWINSGIVPVNLTSTILGYELGPGLLLPNGEVFQIGATSNTALYTPPPPSNPQGTGSWAAGPVIPMNVTTPAGPYTQGADDAPAAELPNGQVMFMVDTTPNSRAPTEIYVYDPVANTLTQQTSSNTTIPPSLAYSGQGAFLFYMLDLPNGDVLMSSSTGRQLWEYTPSGAPLAAS